MSLRTSCVSALALAVIALTGCASSVPVRESKDYNLSDTALQSLTEDVIEKMEVRGNNRWVKLVADAPHTTSAQYVTEGGHRTDLLITYRSLGENKSRAVFDAKSTADLNWLMVGIPGLQGKSDSIRHVDALMDALDARAPGGGPSP